MKPKKLQIREKKELFINWDDRTESVVSLKYLRDECPCAACKGETILFKTLRPPSITVKNESMYEITDIQIVGGYAIQIRWKDGHSTGIYTFDYLRKLASDEENGEKHDYKPLV